MNFRGWQPSAIERRYMATLEQYERERAAGATGAYYARLCEELAALAEARTYLPAAGHTTSAHEMTRLVRAARAGEFDWPTR